MNKQFHRHLGLQVFGRVADDVLMGGELLVVLHVHEMEAFAVVVHELVGALLHLGALDLVGGLVALRGFHAVADPAHVELGDGRALAGVDVFGGQDDVELAVEIDDISLAERAGNDFHGVFLD